MTRGLYNERLPSWLQDLAEINGVNIDSNSEEYGAGSRYLISYRSEEFFLEERRGAKEEIATLLSGNSDVLEELVEEAGLYLDRDRPSGAVITK